MLKTIKKAPERQSFSGVNSILLQRGKGILPTGVIVACPRGANSRGVSNFFYIFHRHSLCGYNQHIVMGRKLIGRNYR